MAATLVVYRASKKNRLEGRDPSPLINRSMTESTDRSHSSIDSGEDHLLAD